MEKDVKHRHKGRSSLGVVGKELLNKIVRKGRLRQELCLPPKPPWESCRSRRYECFPELIGKSQKSTPEEVLRRDARETIQERCGRCRLVIYTDGSATEGFRKGGSAAVITLGGLDNPMVLDRIKKKGRLLTSSYETELAAIRLAAEWLLTEGGDDDVAVCTDSKAAVMTLAEMTQRSRDAMETAVALDALGRRVVVQWVPGHCGVDGNVLADEAANEAAGMEGEEDRVVSFDAAKAAIKREVKDGAPTKRSLREIYGALKTGAYRELSRADAVLLAQLRSGHCRLLAAYRALVSPGLDPICPTCRLEPQTLEHWLECPGLASERRRYLSRATPPSVRVLGEDPGGVVALARATLS